MLARFDRTVDVEGVFQINHVLYMASHYVRFHWGKTVLLVSAISLVLFLPAGLYVVVEQGARMLTAPHESTPLLIGAKGSAWI